MKQNKLFYGMALLATLGLAGCSNDLPGVDPDNQPSDVDRKVYLNLAISGDMVGTRAGAAGDNNGNPNETDDPNSSDFKAGDGQESVVEDVYFVFYDANGIMVGDPVAMNVNQFTEQEAPNSSGTVEKKYYQIVEVDVLKGQETPAQVMCYVNAISSDGLRNPLDQIQTVTRNGVTKTNDAGKMLFPMSNSVYYDTDKDGSPIVVAAQIPNGGAFTTYAAAKAELDKIAADQTSAYVTEIYLERYASKLTFDFPATAATYTAKAGNPNGTVAADNAEFVLTFNVDGWDLNAQSKTTYTVKSFRSTDPTGAILDGNDSYDILNQAINGTATTNLWTWTYPTYHRSYWAKSPAYFQATYPEVASDVDESSAQKYLSYDDIIENGKKAADFGEGFYFMETTVGQPALDSDNPAAAMPSIVVVGHYTMTNGGAAVPVTTGQTGVSFYTYGKYPETTTNDGNTTTTEKPFIYFESASANSYTSAVANGTSIFQRFLNAQTTLYKQVNTEGKISYVKMTADELVSLCEVTHPDDAQLAANNEKLADRRVSLQLKAGANTTGIYVAYNGAYNTIGTAADADNKVITLATANQALRNQVGYAIHYTGGKGFFNIPVQHYGFWRADNPNKGAKKIDWTQVRVGDFGMVRNHVYDIQVKSVSGLATGINGPDIEIIPPRDYQEYFMAIRFNILKWAIVPQQEVEL